VTAEAQALVRRKLDEAREARRREGVPMLPNDQRHGTRNGYGNLYCRCMECRLASRYDQRARRKGGKA
jgi:hypothetical protein